MLPGSGGVRKEPWIFFMWKGCFCGCLLWKGRNTTFWESVSLTAKLKKVKKKRRRDEELSSEESPRRHHHQTKVFAKFSHDAPPPGIKKKHLSIEQLNARRRKVWLSIVKKELPKVSKYLQHRRWQECFLSLPLKEELWELGTFTEFRKEPHLLELREYWIVLSPFNYFSRIWSEFTRQLIVMWCFLAKKMEGDLFEEGTHFSYL